MLVIVHSKSDCPYCKKAKEWLSDHGIAFTETIYDDYDARQAMYDGFGLVNGQRTVPQIVVDDVRIGGYNELLASDLALRAGVGSFDMDF